MDLSNNDVIIEVIVHVHYLFSHTILNSNKIFNKASITYNNNVCVTYTRGRDEIYILSLGTKAAEGGAVSFTINSKMVRLANRLIAEINHLKYNFPLKENYILNYILYQLSTGLL